MGLPNLFMTPFYKRAPYWRACDQIWRNSATLAEVYKSFTNFWQFISCWQNAEPTLANLWHYWANFHLICCIWPNNEKYSNHLVTLNQTVEKSRHIFVCFDGKKWLKIKLWSKINKIVLQHFQIIKSGETNFGIKFWEREKERERERERCCIFQGLPFDWSPPIKTLSKFQFQILPALHNLLRWLKFHHHDNGLFQSPDKFAPSCLRIG